MKRNSIGGKREDLGRLYLRSKWEANYARYLNWLITMQEILKWEYEPDTFEFPVRKGSRLYVPDFKVWNADGSVEYHEIKGYMDQVSQTKLKRMGKYYPGIKVLVIDGDQYRVLNRDLKNLIKNWE